MRLDSGTLTIYRLQNTAAPGLMPQLSEVSVETFCYGERTVGATRFYNAQQADMQVDLLVRIPRSYDILTGDRARLAPYSHAASNRPYLVGQVQQVDDEDTGLPATDLSLQLMREADQ